MVHNDFGIGGGKERLLQGNSLSFNFFLVKKKRWGINLDVVIPRIFIHVRCRMLEFIQHFSI